MTKVFIVKDFQDQVDYNGEVILHVFGEMQLREFALKNFDLEGSVEELIEELEKLNYEVETDEVE